MASAAELTITLLPHPAPTPADVRAAVLANPGFGTNFTDHMVTIEWTEGKGWHDAVIGPRGPIPLDPAASVLHYAQEIFEGLKAYSHADGAIAMFRPEANAARFNERQAPRHAHPARRAVRRGDQDAGAGRSRLDPAAGWRLALSAPLHDRHRGVPRRAPGQDYKFIVIASPAGNYFKSGAPAVSIWVSQYTRAAPGGTGAAKCGGNYAASLVPQAEAMALGHDQVVFLDAAEHKWIEELGGMNLYFVFEDGTLLTPPLSGTILPGITRDSILALAREEGLTVREERYSIDQWRADAASGKLLETFACGTAAVVTPVGKVSDTDSSFTIGTGGPGQTTGKLKERLVAIQRGQAPDTHGWVKKLA
jgi:branched-chain amino acid aminotransferase